MLGRMNEILPLQRVRELAGLSRRVAALRLDVTETTVQRWERGRMPPVHRLRQLGMLYGLTLDQAAAAIEASARHHSPAITAAGDFP